MARRMLDATKDLLDVQTLLDAQLAANRKRIADIRALLPDLLHSEDEASVASEDDDS